MKIQAKSLDLELSGDRTYVVEAYQAIRGVIMDRFELTLGGGAQGEGSDADADAPARHKTQPLHRVETAVNLPEKTVEMPTNHIHVVVTGEIYSNISVIEREQLEKSVLSRVLDAQHLERIYIDRADRDQLNAVLPVGKVLWRELTTAGQAAIRGSEGT
ncbi:MAG: hypothetical protein H0U74_01610 [Bradymonadaceae bacterium]|nr:hypothetical protein [Lujinxingiaceae bacterium]